MVEHCGTDLALDLNELTDTGYVTGVRAGTNLTGGGTDSTKKESIR